MADNLLPSPAELRQLLRYEPETGKLFWRPRSEETASGKRFNSMRANAEALTASKDGYKVGLIYRKNVSAHRVAWALHHGEWPAGEVDHYNGDRADNRIKNLRVVTSSENSRNAKRYRTNTSGVAGITWHKRARKWQANIRVGGKLVHLGLFDCLDLAAQARKLAERLHGFAALHGRE